MRKLWKTIFRACISLLLPAALIYGALYLFIPRADFGFARQIPEPEQALRLQIVQAAESWLGAAEGSEQHGSILDIYNSHEPLAQGYWVCADDNWCDTFASAIAIQCGLTDIIPTECGCQRHIALFDALCCWQEADTYLPLPGDYIFYAWDESPFGDCTGWADHVGIVAGTFGPFIKVIEGNNSDRVSCRYIWRWEPTIRGYGLPDYASKSAVTPAS